MIFCIESFRTQVLVSDDKNVTLPCHPLMPHRQRQFHTVQLHELSKRLPPAAFHQSLSHDFDQPVPTHPVEDHHTRAPSRGPHFVKASFEGVRLRSAPRCHALHHQELQRRPSDEFIIIRFTFKKVNFRQLLPQHVHD